MFYPSDITVIVPSYNSEATIERTLNSLVSQSISGFCVIIVQDGSTDNSSQLVHRFIVNYQHNAGPNSCNFIQYQKENGGVSSARNFGLKKANTKIISFLDSDDIFTSNRLANDLSLFNTDPSIKLISGLAYVNMKPNFTPPNSQEKIQFRNVPLHELIFFNRYQTSTVSMLKENLLFDESKSLSEDYLYWLSLQVGAHISDKFVKANYLSAIYFKPFYGSSGLTHKLLPMELSELDNYLKIFLVLKLRYKILIPFAIIFSLMKFLRRLIKTRIN